MTRDEVMAWVAGYERVWRARDPAALGTLFTEDVRYRLSPYEDSLVGLPALAEVWNEDRTTEFTVTAEPVAVEGTHAVVRLEVRYGGPRPQDYRDLWLLRFADDGRVADFEEWAYWPGKPATAPQG